MKKKPELALAASAIISLITVVSLVFVWNSTYQWQGGDWDDPEQWAGAVLAFALASFLWFGAFLGVALRTDELTTVPLATKLTLGFSLVFIAVCCGVAAWGFVNPPPLGPQG